MERQWDEKSRLKAKFVSMNGMQLCNAAFQQFNEFRRSGDLCDVVLCVDKLEIPAHKVILAAVSPYFKAMFTGKLAESRQERVALRGIQPSSLQHLVDFAYTGTVDIDDENVQFILYTATLLQISFVKDACCRYLEKQLEAGNCLGIRSLSDSLDCKQLFQAAHKFAVEHYQEVIETEEFLLQPYDSIKALTESKSLQISDEEQLARSVLKWIHHDIASRKRYSSKLIKGLHLARLSFGFLKDLLLNDDIINGSLECKDLIQETIQSLESPKLRCAYEFPLFGSRSYQDSNDILFAVGGEALGVTLDSVEFYHPKLDKWSSGVPGYEQLVPTTSRMHQGRSYASLVVTGRHAYVIGGRSSSLQIIDTVERYELPENEWYQMPPLCLERLGAASLVIDNKIFTMGGCGHQGYLASTEVFDVFTNDWKCSVPMSERRCYFGLVSLNDSVYALGGFGGPQQMADNCLRSGESFNPKTESWTPITPMSSKRAYFRTIAFEGSIYALGGYNSSWLNSAERFDPREGQWYNISTMTAPRSSFGASASGNSLFAAGGFDGITNLNSVECYDVQASRWRKVASMTSRRYGMDLATFFI